MWRSLRYRDRFRITPKIWSLAGPHETHECASTMLRMVGWSALCWTLETSPPRVARVVFLPELCTGNGPHTCLYCRRQFFEYHIYRRKSVRGVSHMDSSTTQDWPDRRLKIMIPMWTLLTISTAFLGWRVAYGVVTRRRFMICDYLLIIAGVSLPMANGLKANTKGSDTEVYSAST